MVLTALAEGLDLSAAERVFGYRQATITTWLSHAGEHARTFHERSFCSIHLPHLQLDELRTRLHSATQILWLWLAIDPLTKIIPVLQLGPRTQHRAHLMIHSLRLMLAPGCLLSSIGFLGGREGKDTSICYDEDMNINPHQQGESSCLARIDYRHGSRKCQPHSRI